MSSADFAAVKVLVTSGPCANSAGYQVFEFLPTRSTKSHLDMMRDAIVKQRAGATATRR